MCPLSVEVDGRDRLGHVGSDSDRLVGIEGAQGLYPVHEAGAVDLGDDHRNRICAMLGRRKREIFGSSPRIGRIFLVRTNGCQRNLFCVHRKLSA